MDKNAQIIFLQKLYHTLSLIPTSGEGTLYMANCLNAITDNIASLSITEEIHTQTFDLKNIEKEE